MVPDTTSYPDRHEDRRVGVKAGIADADMRCAIDNAIGVARNDEFTVYVAAGRDGLQLDEIGVLCAETPDAVVIHAHRGRPRYLT
jgi:hypothetical protein